MTSITLDQANTVIAGALQAATEAGMLSLCVVVLDDGGHIKAVARQEGAAFGRFDVARAKANAAVSFGFNGRTIERLAVDRPHFIGSVVDAVGGGFVPVAGGLLIQDGDGNTIGAVGISGDNSDNDEIAAVAGIEAAGLATSPA